MMSTFTGGYCGDGKIKSCPTLQTPEAEGYGASMRAVQQREGTDDATELPTYRRVDEDDAGVRGVFEALIQAWLPALEVSRDRLQDVGKADMCYAKDMFRTWHAKDGKAIPRDPSPRQRVWLAVYIALEASGHEATAGDAGVTWMDVSRATVGNASNGYVQLLQDGIDDVLGKPSRRFACASVAHEILAVLDPAVAVDLTLRAAPRPPTAAALYTEDLYCPAHDPALVTPERAYADPAVWGAGVAANALGCLTTQLALWVVGRHAGKCK